MLRKMKGKNLVFWIAILFELSGWLSFGLLWLRHRPNVDGRILQVQKGVDLENGEMVSYVLYVCVVNASDDLLHLRYFDLEIDYGSGFNMARRKLIQTDIMDYYLKDSIGNRIEIKDFPSEHLYNKNLLLQYGQPVFGFLSFNMPMENYDRNEIRFKVKCYDAYGRVFEILSDDGKLNNEMVFEKANIKFHTN